MKLPTGTHTRKIVPLLVLFAALLGAGLSACRPVFAGSFSVLPSGEGIDALQPSGAGTHLMTVTKVSVSGEPFTDALQVAVSSTPAHNYDCQEVTNTAAAVQQNDRLYAQFYARVIAPAGGSFPIGFGFQKGQPNYDASTGPTLYINSSWRLVRLPFVAMASYATGGARLTFVLGYQPQTIQIADFTCVDLGPGTSMLPSGGGIGSFSLNGSQKSQLSLSTVSVSGQPFFTSAEQITASAPGTEPWYCSLSAPTAAPVQQGDRLYVQFYARATSNTSEISFNFQQAASPYLNSIQPNFYLDGTWRLIKIPFIALGSYATGGASLNLVFGYQAQTVQIADLRCSDYGPGVSVLPSGDGLSTLQPTGSQLNLMTVSTVAVTGEPFTSAKQITIQSAATAPNNCSLTVVDPPAIQSGDTVFAQFYARAVAPTDGSAEMNFNFQINGSPYTKSALVTHNIGTNWELIQVPFQSIATYGANGTAINLVFGYKGQTIQIAGFTCVDFGQGVDPNALWASTGDYHGRDANAPWRVDAAQRIGQYRMGNISVNVTSAANGAPISGAQVHVAMTKNAFGFGGMLDENYVPGSTVNPSAAYGQYFAQNFNKAVLGYDLKWAAWDDDNNQPSAHYYQSAFNSLQYLRMNNIDVRGHNLIWPSWSYMPKCIDTDYEQMLNADGAAAAATWLSQTIDTHIASEAQIIAGHSSEGYTWNEPVEWDVLNEPVESRYVQAVLGDSAMIDWYDTARAADASPRLFINQNSTFDEQSDAFGGSLTDYMAGYQEIIGYLLGGSAPLGGIGFESHFSQTVVPPDQLIGDLNSYAGFGIPLEVTEFDMNTPDQSLVADYLRDYLTIAYSEPQVNGFVIWDNWDSAGEGGIQGAVSGVVANTDFSLTPAGEVWQDLTQSVWHTNVAGATAASGHYAVRGYTGNYTITVTYGGNTVTKYITLGTSGQTVPVGI